MATIVQQTNGEKTIYTSDEYTLVQQQLATMNNSIGTKAAQTDMTNVMSQLADIAINVKQPPYNATGTPGVDDTQAIQSAINYAMSNGGKVYIPRGTYTLLSSLQLNWIYNQSLITGIEGDGDQTELVGTIGTTGRGVLELLGSSNGDAVNMFIRDFRIQMSGGNSGAYCLRVGDSRNFKAERITCEGANCLDLKIASSTSYAEIDALFEQCRFLTNQRDQTVVTDWFSSDDLATLYALNVETGGASWDNVKFTSCEFVGQCQTRAWISQFDNCQFSTNPKRPSGYNGNVLTPIGSVSYNNCYFEDHVNAVELTNGLSHLYNASFKDCHFSGQTNYGVDGTNGILVVDEGNGNKIGNITIEDCSFGTYSNMAIDSSQASTAVVKVNGLSFLYDPSQPVPIKGNIQSFKSEWVKFVGEVTAVNAVSYPPLSNPNFVNAFYYYADFPAWISRVKIIFDAKTTTGNLNVSLLKNGTSVIYENVDTSTNFVNRQTETTYVEGTFYNPFNQTRYLNKGDKLNVHVNSDASYAPLNTRYEVWVEIAY